LHNINFFIKIIICQKNQQNEKRYTSKERKPDYAPGAEVRSRNLVLILIAMPAANISGTTTGNLQRAFRKPEGNGTSCEKPKIAVPAAVNSSGKRLIMLSARNVLISSINTTAAVNGLRNGR